MQIIILEKLQKLIKNLLKNEFEKWRAVHARVGGVGGAFEWVAS